MDECAWAYDLVMADAEVVTDEDPGCLATLGYDESTVNELNGGTIGYGYIHEYFGHANVLSSEVDGVWVPIDNASWDEKTGEFNYDWLDGYPEY